MTNDVNGRDVLTGSERVGDLLDSVGTVVQQNHFDLVLGVRMGSDVVDQRMVVGCGGVNEHYFVLARLVLLRNVILELAAGVDNTVFGHWRHGGGIEQCRAEVGRV